MIIGTSPLPINANAIALNSPVGSQPVGQENLSSRVSIAKPVEQAASSARAQIRREQQPNQDSFAENSRSGDGDQQSSDLNNDEKAAEAREKAQLRQEQAEIQSLSARDREVRAHEQAHAAVGGQYAGAPTYQYERGPNGVRYAVAGEVSIDTGKEATPEETLRKAQIVRRAALAPAEPSPQDRRVAALASNMEAEARAAIAAERIEQSSQSRESSDAEESDQTSREEQASSSPQETPNFPGTSSGQLAQSVANATQIHSRPGLIVNQIA